MKRPAFDPNRARGDTFAGGLFDSTPVRRTVVPRGVTGTEPTIENLATSESAALLAATSSNATDSQLTSVVSHVARSELNAPHEFSVTEFSNLITRALEEGMRGNFRVQGEIANLSKRGHWYFSIKDAGALLSCVMWTSEAARVGFDVREGDAVVVTGKIGHFSAQGRTQLYVSKLEPQGVGALELRFQALVAQLRNLGYFRDERKKPLPAFARCVAVVTSATGAALQDVLTTAKQRCPAVRFIVVDVRVQGDGAAAEVARALRALDARRTQLGIDAVIVTRGGGSREDLWAFNERVVADAAFDMHVPLIAAIGHEVDTSVIELVADRRASTPTQAVMVLLPDMAAMVERAERIGRELRSTMRWSISQRRERLSSLQKHPALASPALRLARAREVLAALHSRKLAAHARWLTASRRELEQLGARLLAQTPAARAAGARATLAVLRPRMHRALTQLLSTRRLALDTLAHRLHCAGPESTLQRGYSIVTDASGTLIRSVHALSTGATIALQLSDGSARATINKVSPHSGNSAEIPLREETHDG